MELELIDEIGGVHAALKHLEAELDLGEGEYRLGYYPDWYMLFLMALEDMSETNLRAVWDYAVLTWLLFR